jgi:hypothetical protein
VKISRRCFLEKASVALAASISAFAGIPNSAEAKPAFKLNKEWLRKDLELAQTIDPIIKEPLIEIDPFLARLKASDTRVDRSIGFGLRQLQLVRYGGYTTVWIHLVALEKRIVAIECVQSADNENWVHIAPVLRKAWTRTPVEVTDSNTTLIHYVDRTRIDQVLIRELGNPPKTSASGAYEKSFNLLLSPLEHLDVGESCYITGERPRGRIAIEQLIKARRFDLIRAILRGPSPEGRTYAALALIRAKNLTADDDTVVRKLKTLDIPIQVCRGCRISTETFADVILDKPHSQKQLPLPF